MINRTAETIYRMLTEKVDSALCDSGEALGYQFQTHRNKNPQEKPEAKWTGFELCVETSLYHFLLENLEYDEAQNNTLRAFLASNPSIEDPGEIIEEFMDEVESIGFLTRSGSEKTNGPHEIINTYNVMSCVDQTIMFGLYKDNYENHFVILSTHNGADVRGGYSTPVVFSVFDVNQFLGFNEAACECENCGARWFTYDNGDTWETCGHDIEMPRDVVYVESDSDFSSMNERSLKELAQDTYNETFGEPERILKREDRDEEGLLHQKVFCPFCGDPLVPKIH